MNITEKITAAFKTAMKTRNKTDLTAIRAIKTAIMTVTKAKGIAPTDGEILKIIQGLIKKGNDSLKIYNEQNRPALAKVEEDEIKVFEFFLPQQMTEEELTLLVKEIALNEGIDNLNEMGKLIGKVRTMVGATASGKDISATVKKFLAQKSIKVVQNIFIN